MCGMWWVNGETVGPDGGHIDERKLKIKIISTCMRRQVGMERFVQRSQQDMGRHEEASWSLVKCCLTQAQDAVAICRRL
jgi:hypothetical protein